MIMLLFIKYMKNISAFDDVEFLDNLDNEYDFTQSSQDSDIDYFKLVSTKVNKKHSEL